MYAPLFLQLCGIVNWELTAYPFSIILVTLLHSYKQCSNLLFDRTTKQSLYLPVRMHGINVPFIVTLFRQRQPFMLKNSRDMNVRLFYEHEDIVYAW